MSLHRTSISKHEHGFTLIEVIFVMALMAVLSGLAVFLSTDILKSNIFHSDLGTITTAIHRTRSRAVNNINESDHGLKILPDKYVFFEGVSYAARDVLKDEDVAISGNFSFSGPDEVVFTRLSGRSNINGDIILNDGIKTATVSINYEGRIEW